MYAVVFRRRMNQDRAPETMERARSEFFPKLEAAPGFVSFALVQGQNGVNTALIQFESKAQTEAFLQEDGGAWLRALDDFGHQVEVRDEGEVVLHTASRH